MKLSRFSMKGVLQFRAAHVIAGVLLGVSGAVVSLSAGDVASTHSDSDAMSASADSSPEKPVIGFREDLKFVLPDEVALDASALEPSSGGVGENVGAKGDVSEPFTEGSATSDGPSQTAKSNTADDASMASSYVGPVKFRASEDLDLIGEGGSGDDDPPAGYDDSPRDDDDDEDVAPYGGYYPTNEEWRTLYQPGNHTKQRKIYPSGLWEWQQGPDDFYSRHESFYRGADRVFGILQQDTMEAWSYGTYRRGFYPTWTGALDLSIPAFYRQFAEEHAMVRLGPVFLDILEVSGSILYSDYDGPETFADGEEPGWLGIVSMTIRGAIKLTPNLYISAVVTPYWLPSNNDWGLSVGYGNGLGANLGTAVGLSYEREIGMWVVSAGDRLEVDNIFGNYWGDWDINEDAYDSAGRYHFGSLNSGGRNSRDGNDFWDGETVVLENTAYARASRYVTPNWVTNFAVLREDDWYMDGFEHLGANNEFIARLDYDGQDMRFAPFFQYRISTGGETEWDAYNQEATVGVRGPITQNLRVAADAGYFWRSGDSGDDGGSDDFQTLTYNLSLIHEFGPYTTQSVSAGNDVYYDDFDGETISRYISYRLEQRLGHRTRAYFYSIGSEEEYLDGPEGTSDNFGIGGGLDFQLGAYSLLFGSVGYEKRQPDNGIETDQMLYTAGASHRLAPSLTLTFQYQYQDYEDDGAGNFDESLYILTLTKGF